MILPWLNGFLKFEKVPLTWFLLALNVFLYLLTWQPEKDLPNLSYQDFKFAARSYQLMQGKKVSDGFENNNNKELFIGAKAIRDQQFFMHYKSFPPTTDAVALANWHQHLQDFEQELKKRSVDIFGLHGNEKHKLSFLTYQFMHSGFFHLFSNMMLFLIFGAAVELLVGSLNLVIIYLLGGIAGAFFFLWMSPNSSAPMVGASASLTAVMAFYTFFEAKKRVRFFYFMAPQEGYWGEIYLPTLLIIPLFFVDDIASLLSTPAELGASVAHGAHIGGIIFGFAWAMLYKIIIKANPRWAQNLGASYFR